MITVNGWFAGGMGGGVGRRGDEYSVNGGDGDRFMSKLFLKTLAEGAVTIEAGGLFQHFTTRT